MRIAAVLQAQGIEHRVQQARFKIRIAHASEAGHLTCTVQLFRIAPALHLVDLTLTLTLTLTVALALTLALALALTLTLGTTRW